MHEFWLKHVFAILRTSLGFRLLMVAAMANALAGTCLAHTSREDKFKSRLSDLIMIPLHDGINDVDFLGVGEASYLGQNVPIPFHQKGKIIISAYAPEGLTTWNTFVSIVAYKDRDIQWGTIPIEDNIDAGAELLHRQYSVTEELVRDISSTSVDFMSGKLDGTSTTLLFITTLQSPENFVEVAAHISVYRLYGGTYQSLDNPGDSGMTDPPAFRLIQRFDAKSKYEDAEAAVCREFQIGGRSCAESLRE